MAPILNYAILLSSVNWSNFPHWAFVSTVPQTQAHKSRYSQSSLKYFILILICASSRTVHILSYDGLPVRKKEGFQMTVVYTWRQEAMICYIFTCLQQKAKVWTGHTWMVACVKKTPPFFSFLCLSLRHRHVDTHTNTHSHL